MKRAREEYENDNTDLPPLLQDDDDDDNDDDEVQDEDNGEGYIATKTPTRKRQRIATGDDEEEGEPQSARSDRWYNRILSYFTPSQQRREEGEEDVDEDVKVAGVLDFDAEVEVEEEEGEEIVPDEEQQQWSEEGIEPLQQQPEEEEEVEVEEVEQAEEELGEEGEEEEEAADEMTEPVDVDMKDEGEEEGESFPVHEISTVPLHVDKLQDRITSDAAMVETQKDSGEDSVSSGATAVTEPTASASVVSASAAPAEVSAVSSDDGDKSDMARLLMDIMNTKWLFIRNDLHGALDAALDVWRRFDDTSIPQPELHRIKNIVYYDMNETVHELIERKKGVEGVSTRNRDIAEALFFFEKKSISAAMKQLRKIINSKAEESKHVMSLVHYLLAQCLMNGKSVKDTDRAMNNIQRAIELDPRPMYLLYNIRGVCHFNRKEYDKAIEDYNAAINLLANSKLSVHGGPSETEIEFDVELFYNRSEAYCMLEEYEKAEKDVLMVIEADKTDKDAKELLRKIQRSKKRKTKAQ